MSVQTMGDPAELRRLVDAIKAGNAAVMTQDTDAFRSAPWVAIRELQQELWKSQDAEALLTAYAEDFQAERDRYHDALRVIAGPEDRGPWIDVYREAGGGYEGLQAIASAALTKTHAPRDS